VAAGVVLVWLLCRWLLASTFGRVCMGIRENELRAQLLGYDVRLIKTLLFTAGGAIAGLAGAFYASWAEIVTPNLFSLAQSAEIIIWVIGGVGTLLGPLLGAMLLAWLKIALGSQQLVNNMVVSGAILIVVVLLLPSGVLPSLMRALARRRRPAAAPVTGPMAARRRRTRCPSTPSDCEGRIVAEIVVETEHLSMRFGGVVAVDGVDFRLRQRELLGLIGPNGAGKTTFFRCLTGQHRPSGGDVWIGGRRTTGLPIHEIARIGVGIKTQVPSLANGLPVRENLWLSARRRHAPRAADEQVERLLTELGLQTHADQPAGQFRPRRAPDGRDRRGDRQRPAVAAARRARRRPDPRRGRTGRATGAQPQPADDGGGGRARHGLRAQRGAAGGGVSPRARAGRRRARGRAGRRAGARGSPRQQGALTMTAQSPPTPATSATSREGPAHAGPVPATDGAGAARHRPGGARG
jgi:ABC-type ATPase involved in cell division